MVKASQQLSFAPLKILYEIKSDLPKKEYITYSKGVQTSDDWVARPRTPSASDSDEESRPGTADGFIPKRRGRRRRERDEEIRKQLRAEIEEEVRNAQQGSQASNGQKENFPSRPLNTEELDAVTSSNDFLDFVDRSSKIIERALDEEYDVLADYRYGTIASDDSDVDDAQPIRGGRNRKGRRLKEVMQFHDDKWSKRRIISDVSFSPKFPELILTSYTKNPSEPYSPPGVIQIWNLHMSTRPEYVFHATSDILTATFSPFHPNLLLGGTYSGQVLLWDTRARHPNPVQRTPLTGMGTGHTHPVYSLNVVGTQNAHNIVSTSTDGVLCSWAMDMLAHPQECLSLSAPPSLPPSTNSTSSLYPTPKASPTNPPPPHPRPPPHSSPLCTTFPHSDPTYLLTGTESGNIHLAHRYDRAGARSGVDARVLYAGHFAPVTALDFHKPAGPLDLSDLMLSCGLDWSIKLWRVRTPAAATIGTPDRVDVIAPVLEVARDDAVYDVKWSPLKPGVFASVDGSGALEVWDLAVESEIPVARAVPEVKVDGVPGLKAPSRALNKCAWEPHEGRRVAAGGLDGVLSVWEVGSELGGRESARSEEWGRVRLLVAKAEGKSEAV